MNCLVIGGSGDIGKSISYAQETVCDNVIVLGRKKNPFSSNKIKYYNCDLNNFNETSKIIKKIIDKFKRIDTCICCTGTQYRSKFLESNRNDWNNVFTQNFFHFSDITRLILPNMLNHNYGRFIYITSLTAEIGINLISAYASAKAAVKEFSKSMTAEYSNKNITFNCIGPGRIETQMTSDIIKNKTAYNSTLKAIPMNRWGKPEDISEMTLFLGSKAASYISGQSIYIDGGWLATGGNINS